MRPLPRRAPLLLPGVLAVLSAACSSSGEPQVARVSAELTNATGPSSDKAVGAVVLRRSACDAVPDQAYCTATLVADQVVLTAGHCVDPFAPDQLELFFGERLGDPQGVYRGVTGRRIHPQYSEASSDFDLALLWLDSPVDAAPAALLRTSLDDAWIGRQVRVVGYGDTRTDAAAPAARAEGTAVITALDAHTFRYAPDPSMTCNGDSGGPAFASVGGADYLVGVTSAGDPGCSSYGVDTRIDVVVADFIDVALAADPPTRTPTVAPGAACTELCESDTDCPWGLLCDHDDSGQGRCGVRGIPAGSYEGTCAHGQECASGECVALGSSCACHTPCEGVPEPQDDAGPPVKPPEDPQPTSGDGGGCSVGAVAGAPVGTGAMWVVVLWVAARKRRRALTAGKTPRCLR